MLWYGGDWNPEQWPEPVWHQDVALMREAGVNLVSVGVFAWARLEPAPGRFTFDWLDRALDLLHEAGIQANLATPTASPPPWFSLAHPDALPVTAQGVRLVHGSRNAYCAAAPGYRAAARRIATALAHRYAGHPALAMWHVHNEYGTVCHCDHAAAGFRRWLRERYRDDLAALNDAWGTACWSQTYSAWEEVLPPRATQWLPNPHQALDYRRFWSDELLAAYCEQRDVLRAAAPGSTPGVAVTTNFAFGDWVPIDHRRWAQEVDLVALDAYPEMTGEPAEPQPGSSSVEEEVAFLADLARHWGTRSVTGQWLLLEQAPGTLLGPGVRVPTAPGRLARLSAAHVARGSRGVMFFQWRASAAGAEQYHPGMVPHAGPDTRIFTEVRELGARLPELAAGGRVVAPVAIAWDAESWWALWQRDLPSDRLDYLAALRRAHRALWCRQVTTDFADLGGDLSPYQVVLVPSHYLASDAQAAAVREYVGGGGHLVVWFFSGVADPTGRVRLGGYPGAFREVLGIRVTELHPLPPGATAGVSDGSAGTVWAEQVELAGAEPVLRYADGPLAGQPAVTRHRYGQGVGWYVSTELADAPYRALLDSVLARAGVGGGDLPPGVEVVRRDTGHTFVLNHTAAPVTVAGRAVAPGEVVVLPG